MKKSAIIAGFILIALIATVFVITRTVKAPTEVTMQPDSQFKLDSPAFAENGEIPELYTCKGKNISPPLTIGGVPHNAASLALVLHDPDAPNGDWLHWTVWNINPNTQSFDEGKVPDSATQGTTSFGNTGYGGPCPPSGTHRYIFDLYALDKKLDLPAGSDRKSLEQAIQGHITAQTKLVGIVGTK